MVQHRANSTVTLSRQSWVRPALGVLRHGLYEMLGMSLRIQKRYLGSIRSESRWIQGDESDVPGQGKQGAP